MKKTKNIFWIFIFLGFIQMRSSAQDLNKQIQRQNQTVANRHAIRDSLWKHELKRRGITDEKLSQLKKIGVDLKEYGFRSSGRDPRVDAVLKEVVVIGKVINIIDVPGAKEMPYHSIVKLLVLEVFKGTTQAGDTLQLLREDGPITGELPGTYVEVTHTAKFSKGEIAFFFLDNVYMDSYFTSRYKSFLLKDSILLPNPAYFVHPGFKHELINSIVKYGGKEIPLGTFKAEIKKVSQILQ